MTFQHCMVCAGLVFLKSNQGYVKPLCNIKYDMRTDTNKLDTQRVLCAEVYINSSLWRHVAFVGSVKNKNLYFT